MKKLTNYQRTAQYLNKVFKLINEEYFNNELEVPTITIQYCRCLRSRISQQSMAQRYSSNTRT